MENAKLSNWFLLLLESAAKSAPRSGRPIQQRPSNTGVVEASWYWYAHSSKYKTEHEFIENVSYKLIL